MAGGPPIYFTQRQISKHVPVRLAAGVVFIIAGLTIGKYYENLARHRYSLFRGRTALYGDSTLNGGRQL